jgi:hypothetical protein
VLLLKGEVIEWKGWVGKWNHGTMEVDCCVLGFGGGRCVRQFEMQYRTIVGMGKTHTSGTCAARGRSSVYL